MAKYLTHATGGIVEASTVDASTGAPDAGKIPALGASGVLHSSLLPAGAPGGVDVIPVVVDFGAIPVRARTFTGITAAGVAVGQQVIASVSADMPGGRSSDELEMDPLVASAMVTSTDTVTVVVASLAGPVTGQIRINLIAA